MPARLSDFSGPVFTHPGGGSFTCATGTAAVPSDAATIASNSLGGYLMCTVTADKVVWLTQSGGAVGTGLPITNTPQYVPLANFLNAYFIGSEATSVAWLSLK